MAAVLMLGHALAAGGAWGYHGGDHPAEERYAKGGSSMSDLKRTDTVSRLVAASPGTIFQALIDPGALVKWLPPQGMTGEMHSFDARPGGRFHLTLTYLDPDPSAPGKSSSGSDVIEAEFAELVPDERVVWLVEFASDDEAFAGVMRMSWLLRATGTGTEVVIVASDVPTGISRHDHEVGMGSTLENLAGFVERGS